MSSRKDPTKGKIKEVDIPEEVLAKEQEIRDELADVKKVEEWLLSRLFTSTVKDLIAKIEAGCATPTDKANAIRILKDNNITMDVSADPDDKTDLDELADCLLPEVSDMDFDTQLPN